jgi:hypothetical protein
VFLKPVLQVGFASNPTDPIASTVWTDISAYLLDADWENGGRDYELDQAVAGTYRAKLRNDDRRFEPEYASSPYFPNVLPLKRLRQRLGENAVTNPSLETDTTGWSVGATFSISRSTVQFLMAVASLKTTYISGSASSDMGAISVTAPAAGRYAYSAYVYIPTAWNGGTISVNAENYAGSSEVTALRHDANLALRDQWQRIWRVYDIAGGDLVGDLRLRCASFPSGTPFIYTDGVQVATLDANSELQPYVDQAYDKFNGFIEEWQVSYDSKFWSFVTVTATDGFEPLTNADVMGGPNMMRNPSFEVDATQWAITRGTLARDTTQKAAGVASGKFACDASVAPAEIKPAILGIKGATYYAASARIYIPSGLGITASDVTVGLGVTGGSEVSGVAQALFDQWQTVIVPVLFTGGGEQLIFGNTTPGNSVKARLPANQKFASRFYVDQSCLLTDLRLDLGPNYEDFQVPPGQLMRGVVYDDSAGSPNNLLGSSDEVNDNSAARGYVDFIFSTPPVIAGGAWYWFGVHAGSQNNGSFFYYDTNQGSWAQNVDSYVDGASAGFGTPTTLTRLLAMYATCTAGVVATDGYAFVRINETGTSKFIYVDEMVVREVPVTALDLTDPTGADLDVALVSLRVSRILNMAAWPVADRAIDTGIAVMAAMTADPASSTKALGLLHDCADAELGVFFCSGAGKAAFHDRSRRWNPALAAVFTDGAVSPGVFPYVTLVPNYSKTRIWNDVRISPAAGETQILADSASRTAYGPRTLSKSLQLDGVTQAHDLAEGILSRTKDPHQRLETLSLHPVAHELIQPGITNAVLKAEVSDAFTVKMTPPGGGAQNSKDVHLEKAKFVLDEPGYLKVDWQLSPVAAPVWTVEDPVYGAVDVTGVAF